VSGHGAELQHDTSRDVDLLAGVHDGAWLTGQDFPDLRFAVEGLIPEGLTLLIGPPKAGKSWLALALLLAVASGGVALGVIKTPARRVLYPPACTSSTAGARTRLCTSATSAPICGIRRPTNCSQQFASE
jgi:hypothetical protein